MSAIAGEFLRIIEFIRARTFLPRVRGLLLPHPDAPDRRDAEFCALELEDGSVGFSFVSLGDTLMRLRAGDYGVSLPGTDPGDLSRCFLELDETRRTLGFAAVNAVIQCLYRWAGFSPDPLLANTVKLNITRNIYEICRLAHDVAGGFIATLPSEMDLRHPAIGKYVEKYFVGVSGVPTEHRIRMGRLIENMTAGTALIESMHSAGSPQAQQIMILRQAKLKEKMSLAERLAGVGE